MGMFDEVGIRYPLPEGYEQWQNHIFQTKSLGSGLDYYLITSEGVLEMKPYGGDDSEWTSLDHHGDIYLLGLEQDTRVHQMFRVRFTHGRVEWVEALPKPDWMAYG